MDDLGDDAVRDAREGLQCLGPVARERRGDDALPGPLAPAVRERLARRRAMGPVPGALAQRILVNVDAALAVPAGGRRVLGWGGEGGDGRYAAWCAQVGTAEGVQVLVRVLLGEEELLATLCPSWAELWVALVVHRHPNAKVSSPSCWVLFPSFSALHRYCKSYSFRIMPIQRQPLHPNPYFRSTSCEAYIPMF